MSEAKAILKSLKREANDLPRSDYRLNSEKAEKPLGLLSGGLKIVDEFAKASFKHVPEVHRKHLVLVNEAVQLYLTSEDQKVNSVAMAIFPIFEPNFVGMGNIYLGAYETKIEGVTIRESKVREANLYFLKRDNPEAGYNILVRDAKHKDVRFSAIYKMGPQESKLVQFGISDKGFFNPITPDDPKMGLVSFPDEDPIFYGGSGTFDLKRYTREIMMNYQKLQRAVKDYGLDFKDDWAKSGTLQLKGDNT